MISRGYNPNHEWLKKEKTEWRLVKNSNFINIERYINVQTKILLIALLTIVIIVLL